MTSHHTSKKGKIMKRIFASIAIFAASFAAHADTDPTLDQLFFGKSPSINKPADQQPAVHDSCGDASIAPSSSGNINASERSNEVQPGLSK
jgi:hypothetical protein